MAGPGAGHTVVAAGRSLDLLASWATGWALLLAQEKHWRGRETLPGDDGELAWSEKGWQVPQVGIWVSLLPWG